MTATSSSRAEGVRRAFEGLTQHTAIIRAVYIVSVATSGPRDEILCEFHQAVGDLLEGAPLASLRLTRISKAKVREEVAWLRERK